MTTHRVQLRAPHGATRPLEPDEDGGAYLHDASFAPGGHSSGVFHPRSEREVSDALRAFDAVLPVGAQSSVTGGATPYGETVLSLRHFNSVKLEDEVVCVGAGVSLRELQTFLDEHGCWFPGAPTYDGAQVGGALSTNAAGATTFKYGSVRDHTLGLTVVLADGDVLEVTRGQHRAHPDGFFELSSADQTRTWRVPVPTYAMPQVDKRAAGYFATPEMDLVDLFIGAEGTLGVVVEARLRVVSPRPRVGVALVPCATEDAALSLTADLHSVALEHRANPPEGLDVSAVEYMDARCVALLREDGSDARLGFRLRAGTLLLVQLDLLESTEALHFERFTTLLERHGVLDHTVYAAPGEAKASAAMFALREAVPEGINARFARVKRDLDPRITKAGADMVVPFHRLPEAMRAYRTAFAAAGVDYAIWGHASDGNMHPNMLPRHWDDVAAAKQAILGLGRTIQTLGGCPLAEHGVGRNPVKQALLEGLYGVDGIQQMRAVKRALDPRGVLAPGVLFPS